ncbi:MAG: glycosyltransferase family 2 protein [Egibacteraceae bacterium]
MVRVALFWTAAATVLYTYAVYPLVVLLRGAVGRRPYRTADITPTVSVLVAAHNEADNIGAKLENLVGLQYPGEQLEIVVASDGSDDDTDRIVAAYRCPAVRLLALPRVGKAQALNAAVAASAGEILVFTDANSAFAADALRWLVRPFADPGVGGVAGDQRYLEDGGGPRSGEGERRYWDFDRMLKRAQSAAGSAVSATGAIYAVRRALFQQVPEGVTDDFATSTAVVAAGYRLVFEPRAIAYEPVAPSSGLEFARKVRVITRGLRGVAARRELLDVRRHGFYALQLTSHKVLRRTMVFPLVAIAATSPGLRRRGPVYRAAALAQVAGYGLGVAGLALSGTRVGHKRVLAIPAYFCMVNVAALNAAWNLVRGRRIDRWEPRRSTR